MTVDVPGLERLLAERLRVASVRLERLGIRCHWPVFRGAAPGLPAMFVKVNDRPRAERTLALARASGRLPVLPKSLLADLPEFAGHAVLCLEWTDARCVLPEDMTDRQFDSLADACIRFADVLDECDGRIAVPAAEDSPDGQYAMIADYAARHPLAGRLLRPLLSVPEALRSYRSRPLRLIHGDFQYHNYGFDGERLAAIFDFDALTWGLACEDAAYAFTERIRRGGLSSAARARLTELFLRLVKRSPWPKDEWLVAVNHARLRIASRRVESHPDAFFTAVDIRRRDRPLAWLAKILGGFRA